MAISKKPKGVNKGVNNKWIWFQYSCIGAALPIILRFLICIGKGGILFDVKDFYFFSLALSLSNFNLVAHTKAQSKDVVINYSVALISIVAALIGSAITAELYAKINEGVGWVNVALAIIFSIASLRLSFIANKYVIESV